MQKLACLSILFPLVTLFNVKSLCAQAELVIGKSVYVWSFLPPISKDSTFKTIAAHFTNEFEDALVQTGTFVVMQRRNRPRIVEQLENEKKIMGLKQFSKNEIEALSKALKVDAVIFGEITDDIESGLLQIRVAAESFDERILTRESILFPRWQKSHLPSRQDSMRALIKKIVPNQNLGSNPGGGTSPQSPDEPEELPSTEVNKFVFALRSCKLSGRNLTCTLLITNKGEDRNVSIDTNDTRIFDADGNEYIAKSSNIGARGSSARIASGVPVRLSIDFGPVAAEFKKALLFEIKFAVTYEGIYFAQLRDFSVEK
ncbi:CsgG/HfaB family protein [bacterium]|nr:CsgG/HfaB family protein [bacterium]